MHEEIVFSNSNDSMPTTTLVAVLSNLNDSIQVINDNTDAEGTRHVTIQTNVTGNDRQGYKAAELLAHVWFFLNYDVRGRKDLDPTLAIAQLIGTGYLKPHWLEAAHPVIDDGNTRVMFGHHLGIDPTDDEPTWRFEFEIVPMKTKTNPLAVESNQQQSATTDVKLFSVPVTAEVPFDLTGYVRVYALEADQAFEKVQLQIDTDTLDDDLEMEEADWLCRLPYGQVKFCYGVNIGINRSDIELIENDVDPADVLKVEVKELHERVAWNAQKLARHKAFLASLIESAAAA